MIEIHDARQGADRMDAGRRAARFAPLVDRDHSETAVGAQTSADQVQIAGFEDPQRQDPARKQHGVQWKQGSSWVAVMIAQLGSGGSPQRGSSARGMSS